MRRHFINLTLYSKALAKHHKNLYISYILKKGKKMRALIVITITLLILLPFASAEIVLPQFKDVYSTGDSIDSSFEIMESQDLTELVKLKLSCGEKTLFYTEQITLKANEVLPVSASPEIRMIEFLIPPPISRSKFKLPVDV